jgi:hypothetical protein
MTATSAVTSKTLLDFVSIDLASGGRKKKDYLLPKLTSNFDRR